MKNIFIVLALFSFSNIFANNCDDIKIILQNRTLEPLTVVATSPQGTRAPQTVASMQDLAVLAVNNTGSDNVWLQTIVTNPRDDVVALNATAIKNICRHAGNQV